jgi:hypothetical protein
VVGENAALRWQMNRRQILDILISSVKDEVCYTNNWASP